MDLANFGSVTAFTDKDVAFRRTNNLGYSPSSKDDRDCSEVRDPGSEDCRRCQRYYWTTFEDELVESPSILARLLSKEYCTPEIMKRRYFDSKLLNMLFARAFQQRLPPSIIAIDSVNPGFCISSLRSSLHEVHQEADAKQEDELTELGSRQRVFSAVVEECDFVIGKDVQDEAWDEIMAILDGVDSKVVDVIRQYVKNWIHEVPLRSKCESNISKLGLLAVV
ncbi:uncharacterized protein ARMOST_16090 [Armillaria ostoyae]|uniref:Uncharacterized protein n=1 Tax=Armillaria ostoyae TaxID=47428 RepID=A0A284RV93_ARMOS|nr:uncharacterized protein ARMOST_16090 [Armillaria ostoyae]